MLIVKRKNQLRDWPTLPDGGEVEAIIGILEEEADADKLMSNLAKRINEDPQFKDDKLQEETWTAECDHSADSGLPIVVVINEDNDLIWFTIELERAVVFDHETINNMMA